ncbi:hypothetical protein L0244_40450 [bacterium]|nr:hypothetical protein [bacterium]
MKNKATSKKPTRKRVTAKKVPQKRALAKKIAPAVDAFISHATGGAGAGK